MIVERGSVLARKEDYMGVVGPWKAQGLQGFGRRLEGVQSSSDDRNEESKDAFA